MRDFNTVLVKLDEVRLGYEMLHTLLALAPANLEVNANNLGHLVNSLNKNLQQCCIELEQFEPVPTPAILPVPAQD